MVESNIYDDNTYSTLIDLLGELQAPTDTFISLLKCLEYI